DPGLVDVQLLANGDADGDSWGELKLIGSAAGARLQAALPVTRLAPGWAPGPGPGAGPGRAAPGRRGRAGRLPRGQGAGRARPGPGAGTAHRPGHRPRWCSR